MATPPMIKTNELKRRLCERYAAPAYAFFEEVANGTGFYANRHLDGLAFSLWPSRGLTLTGFEIKVSRTDWQKELKQPAKAETIAAYCDYFYLVVGDRSIVHPGELPDTWGLIVPFGQKLKIEKEATKMEAMPLDRLFVAAICRKVGDKIMSQAEAEKIKKDFQMECRSQYEKGLEKGKSAANPGLYDRFKKLDDQVKRFKEQTGIDFHAEWDDQWPEDVGRAINVLRRSDQYSVKNLEKMVVDLKQVVAAMRSGFSEIGKESQTNA